MTETNPMRGIDPAARIIRATMNDRIGHGSDLRGQSLASQVTATAKETRYATHGFSFLSLIG